MSVERPSTSENQDRKFPPEFYVDQTNHVEDVVDSIRTAELDSIRERINLRKKEFNEAKRARKKK